MPPESHPLVARKTFSARPSGGSSPPGERDDSAGGIIPRSVQVMSSRLLCRARSPPPGRKVCRAVVASNLPGEVRSRLSPGNAFFARPSPPTEHPDQHRHHAADHAPGPGAHPRTPSLLAHSLGLPALQRPDSGLKILIAPLHPRKRPADPLYIPVRLVDELPGSLLPGCHGEPWDRKPELRYRKGYIGESEPDPGFPVKSDSYPPGAYPIIVCHLPGKPGRHRRKNTHGRL